MIGFLTRFILMHQGDIKETGGLPYFDLNIVSPVPINEENSAPGAQLPPGAIFPLAE